MSESEAESESKGKKITNKVEKKIVDTFPWIKTSLGGIWTIFWVIIAFTIEAIFFLIPVLLAVAGVLFILVLLFASNGFVGDIALYIGGSGKSKKHQKPDKKL